LVTSFVPINLSDPYFLRKGFWHTALANDWREFRPSQGILSRKEMVSVQRRFLLEIPGIRRKFRLPDRIWNSQTGI